MANVQITETLVVNEKFTIKIVTTNNRPCAQVWQQTPKGKWAKEKCIDYVGFTTEAARQEWVEKRIASIFESERVAIERKAEKSNRPKEAVKNGEITEGSIFYHSWGYDQTNIDFYQVVSLSGTTVKIRQLCAEIIESEWGGGKIMPIKDKFYNDEELTKRILSTQKSLYLSFECGWCSAWDGRAKSYTNYR